MKKILFFLLLTAVFCQTAPIRAAESAEDANLVAKEKEITRQRMLQINDAIQAYRKDHKELPGYLSDLYPKYIADTNIFLCPTALRQNQELPFAELRDPKLTVHYGYEFNARPIQGMFGYSGPITMGDWKRMQMTVVGGAVPLLRCFAYDKVINISFDGNLYESGLQWEDLFQDKIKPGELEPSHLRLVMLKNLGGAGMDREELAFEELQDAVNGMDREELAFEKLKNAVSGNNRGVMASPATDEAKKWDQEVVQTSMDIAAQAHKFLAEFPQNTNISQAAQLEQRMLLKATAAGSAEADQQLEALLSEKLKEPGLSEDEHFAICRMQVQASQAKLQDKPESERLAAFQLASRELIEKFPKRSEPYQMLLSTADEIDPAKSQALIDEVSQSTNAPDKVKQQAQALFRRLNLLGHPLDIQFTALNGRKVDFAQLKGKVVLVDFWATWCGPCVGEIPHVKEAYEKFHTNGFEIVGISFDSNKSALEKFVKSKDMPWPQYFDGKGWENAYGQQFGINSIPTMWLVDRKGNVVDTNAREDLSGKVEHLVADK